MLLLYAFRTPLSVLQTHLNFIMKCAVKFAIKCKVQSLNGLHFELGHGLTKYSSGPL
jgi:hypothetical protein